MATFLHSIPAWVGAVGWLAVLLGFGLQRKAFMSVSNKTSIKGNRNSVTNTTNQGTQSQNDSADHGSGDSTLSRWGSWASLVGLVLTLLPLLKEWFGKAA